MAWPKGQPRKPVATENEPAKTQPSLNELNMAAKRRRQADIAKRNACINEMMKPYIEAYGPKKIKQVRSFLASVIDGKRLPHEKKVPLRIPPDGNIGVYNGKTSPQRALA